MHSAPDQPVILAYDGSDGARRAIDVAGELHGGGPAVVVFVWKPLSAMMLWNPVLGGPGPLKDAADEIDSAGAEEAERIAAEGAARARAAGFDAEPLAVRDAGTWQPIVKIARERDARLVVVGYRGAHGDRALFPGSVASGVLHHSSTPVLVVPPAPTPR